MAVTYLITYTSSGIKCSLHSTNPEQDAASLKRLKLVKDVTVHKITYTEIPSSPTPPKGTTRSNT